MIDELRLLIAFILVVYALTLKELSGIFMTLLFSLAFFEMLHFSKLAIPGVMNNANIAFAILLLTYLIFRIQRQYSVFRDFPKLFKYLFLYFFICILSYINTIIYYPTIESLKIAFYFLSYISIYLFYFIFKSIKIEKIKSLLRIIDNLSFINTILFLLYALFLIKIIDINEKSNANMLIDSLVLRVGDGVPLLLAYFLTYNYLSFRTDFNVFRGMKSITYLFAVFITMARGYLYANLAILIFVEIYLSVKTKSFRFINIALFFLVLIIVSQFISGNTMSVITERLSEVSSANSIDDVGTLGFRYYAAEERIEYAMQNNPFIGTGFVNTFKTANIMGFNYYHTYIHHDIYYPNIILTTGIIGFILLVMIFYSLFKIYLRNLENRYVFSAFGFLLYVIVHSFSSNYLYTNIILFCFIASLGLKFSTEEMYEPDKEK